MFAQRLPVFTSKALLFGFMLQKLKIRHDECGNELILIRDNDRLVNISVHDEFSLYQLRSDVLPI